MSSITSLNSEFIPSSSASELVQAEKTLSENSHPYKNTEHEELDAVRNTAPVNKGLELSLSQRSQVATNIIASKLTAQLGENVFAKYEEPSGAEQHLSEEKSLNNRNIGHVELSQSLVNMVEHRYQELTKNGHSPQEISGQLAGVLENINQGIESAKSELSELSLDSQSVIELSHSQTTVNQYVHSLTASLMAEPSDHEQLNNNDLSIKHVQPLEQNQQNVDNQLSNQQQLNQIVSQGLNELSLSQHNQESSARSSDLTIKTADGDIVNISFLQQQSSQSNSQWSYGENTIKQSHSYESSEHSHFSFTIEGDIDDDELKAIFSLINDVQALQQEFFNGDIEKAFQQALTMGFDEQELAGFSLDLLKTKQSVSSTTYNAVANFDQPKHLASTDVPIAKQELTKVLSFIDQIKELQQSSIDVWQHEKQQTLDIIAKTVEVASADRKVQLVSFESFYQKFDQLLTNKQSQES